MTVPGSELMIIIACVVTAAAVIALAWLFGQSRKSRKSLEQLADTAARLTQGDWTARVPIDPFRKADTFSTVGHAFNRMAVEMKRRYDRSHRERDQLHTVLTNMSDGVLAIDGQGVVRLVNRAFLRYFRSVFEDPVGHLHSEAFRERGLNDLVVDLLNGTASEAMDLVVSKPTRRILVLRSAQIEATENPSDVRCVIVARDVTARRRVEQMRRDFVANVSHELRTPLTAILGYVEALRSTALGAEEQTQFLGTIFRNATRMNRIVADLLELSRIEAPDYHPNIQHFPLRPLVDEVCTSLNATLAGKSQALALRIDPGIDTILADRDAIYRIFFNLIDNAHKYTPEHGHLVVAAAMEDHTLTLSVEDDGIGVPEDDRPRLFERFFRVDRDRSRQSGGTGLGLAIVKHLAESMGGTARYEPSVPRGSRFIVTLPQIETEETPGSGDE